MKLISFLLLLPVLSLADSFPNVSGYYDASAWTQAVHEFEPNAIIAGVNSGPGTPRLGVTYNYFDHYNASGSFTTPVSIQNGSFSMVLQSSGNGYSYGLTNFNQPILAFGAEVSVKPIDGNATFALAGNSIPGIGYPGPRAGNGSFNGFFGFLYTGPPSNGFALTGGGIGEDATTVSFTIDRMIVAVLPTAAVATPEPGAWQLAVTGIVFLSGFLLRRRSEDQLG